MQLHSCVCEMLAPLHIFLDTCVIPSLNFFFVFSENFWCTIFVFSVWYTVIYLYNIYDKHYIPWNKKNCRKKFSFCNTELRMQRSLKMTSSSTLTLLLWNICYASNERKLTGFVNRSATGNSQRKEIHRQIPFISFSISVRLMLSCNICQILQPSQKLPETLMSTSLPQRPLRLWQLTSSGTL